MEENKIKENKLLINENKTAKKTSNNKKIVNKRLNLKISKNRGQDKGQPSKSKYYALRRNILCFFGFIIIIFLILFLIYKYLYKKEEESEFYKTIYNRTIEKDKEEEYRDIQNYMDLVFNGTIIDKDKT